MVSVWVGSCALCWCFGSDDAHDLALTAVASAPVTNDTVDLLLQSRFSKGYSCSCCRSRDNAFVSNYAPLLSQSGLPCSHCTRANY